MKKFLFAFSFFAVLGSQSQAATSASLVLKGMVPSLLTLELSSESIATSLPLNVTQANTKVGTVVEKSNSATGYKITVDSQNKGKLIRNGGNEAVNYTMNYGGQGVNLQSAQQLTYSGAFAGTRTRDVQISYQAVPFENLVAGEYNDTVTFTISAN